MTTTNCEAFVENDHGHLFLFALEDGIPIYRREFFIKGKDATIGGRFNPVGFRKHQLDILDFIRHPDEEIILHGRNQWGDDYTMTIVGCTKTNPGVIEDAILADIEKQEADGKLAKREAKRRKKHDKRKQKDKDKMSGKKKPRFGFGKRKNGKNDDAAADVDEKKTDDVTTPDEKAEVKGDEKKQETSK